MAKKVKCIIIGWTMRHDGTYYVNNMTTSPDDIWHTLMPRNYNEEKNGPATPKKIFESGAIANEYLKRIKRDTSVSGEDIRWTIERI